MKWPFGRAARVRKRRERFEGTEMWLNYYPEKPMTKWDQDVLTKTYLGFSDKEQCGWRVALIHHRFKRRQDEK